MSPDKTASDTPKRITILCNPFAGSGSATKMAKEAEHYSKQRGWQVIANLQSAYAGHIEHELACQFASNTDLFILIGGDGTLRELIAGLRKNHAATDIAFIPMGNANVVARELNIPLQPLQALQMLDSSTTVAIDIGILKISAEESTSAKPPVNMIFLAMLEIGFGAKIVHMVNQFRSGKLKRLYQLWGDLVYAIAGFLAFIQRSAVAIRVEHINKTDHSRHIVISNMKTYAKGWVLSPEANCQDGLLDIAMNKKGSKLSTLMTFLLAAQRKTNDSSAMVYSQAKEVLLSGSPSAWVQVDGDPIHFSGLAKVSIEPQAFNIHVPLTQ